MAREMGPYYDPFYGMKQQIGTRQRQQKALTGNYPMTESEIAAAYEGLGQAGIASKQQQMQYDLALKQLAQQKRQMWSSLAQQQATATGQAGGGLAPAISGALNLATGTLALPTAISNASIALQKLGIIPATTQQQTGAGTMGYDYGAYEPYVDYGVYDIGTDYSGYYDYGAYSNDIGAYLASSFSDYLY